MSTTDDQIQEISAFKNDRNVRLLPAMLLLVVCFAEHVAPVAAAAAPGPSLVRDIKPVIAGLSSNPQSFVTSGTTTYFIASTASTGAELWKTDGTAGNTGLVKDIHPGSTGSSIAKMTFVNDTLFFVATSDADTGPELWKSDGSEPGTLLVKDINPFLFSGSSINSVVATPSSSLTAYNGKVYFSASDGTNGAELWSSDGTADGTQMVANTHPSGSAMTSNHMIVASGGKLFFSASNGTNGTELWVIDGASAPQLLDIRSGSLSSFPNNAADFNGTLYFAATGAAGGVELYKSDGGAVGAGTELVMDINKTGTQTNGLFLNGSSPSLLTVVGSTLYFRASNGTTAGLNGTELWKSDGAAANTEIVEDIVPGTASSGVAGLCRVGNKLFFTATADDIGGTELWVAHGSGAELAGDITPEEYFSSNIGAIFDVNGTAFFRAWSTATGYEIFKSDGTNGIQLVADIQSGTDDGIPSTAESGVWWGALGTRLLFAAKDPTLGTELWAADENGAQLVADLSGGGDSEIAFAHGVDGSLYFTADDGSTGQEPWFTQGTSETTVQLKDISPGSPDSSPAEFRTLNGAVTFTAQGPGAGYELWKTNGTAAGTAMLRDINVGPSASTPLPLGMIGNTLYMTATDTTTTANTGRELWRTDGTAAGTALVKDINPGAGSSNPLRFTVLNGVGYFIANDGVRGYELWRTDGSNSGTVLVEDINPGAAQASPDSFVTVGDSIFFRASDPTNGTELWKTDGTAGGTVLVKDIVPGPDSSNPGELTELDGLLYFVATDAASGEELWVSDGSADGTLMLSDIREGAAGSSPGSLIAVNGRLHFTADDGVHGVELWRTDGAAGITELVKDIKPGAEGSSPGNLTAAGDALAFSSDDGSNGRELWASDGSAPGTFLVKNLAAGITSSLPANLAFTGSTLYFTADEHSAEGIGNELYSTPLASLDVTSPTVRSVIVRSSNIIDVVFSEPVDSASRTAGCFALSGSGQGGLSGTPDSVTKPSPKISRLRWSTGSLAAAGDVTVTVDFSIQDLAGNNLGAPNSGTDTVTGVTTQPLSIAPFGVTAAVTSASGMLVDDTNRDGNPDVIVLDSATNGGTILRGLGNGAWDYPSALSAGGVLPRGAAIGNFYYDSSHELIVANEGDDTVSWHYDFGGVRQTIATVGDAPRAVLAGDFNLDGGDDLVVANSGSNTVTFIKSTRPEYYSTVFTVVDTYSVGTTPSALAEGDFNRDGRLDVVCANTGSDNISLLLGNGTGGFGPILTFAAGTAPTSLAVGDLNRDGRLDVAVANEGSDDVSILLGSAVGTLRAGVEVLVGSQASSVAIGDFDRDGIPDLAASAHGASAVAVCAGVGDGTFHTANLIAVPVGARAVAAVDVDDDSDPDLIVVNETLGTVSILRNNTLHQSAKFVTASTVANAASQFGLITRADLNRDGHLDLLGVETGTNEIAMLIGDGQEGFIPAASLPYTGAVLDLALDDFNRDGKIDLLVTQDAAPSVSVRLGEGNGSFGPALPTVAAFEPVPPAVADYNNDGYPDLVGVVGSAAPFTAALYYGDGAGAFGDSGTSFEIPAPKRLIGAEIYRSNFTPDLVVLNRDEAALQIYMGKDEGSLHSFALPQALPAVGDAVTVCDFDRNTNPDLAITSPATGEIFILPSHGSGFFTPLTFNLGGQPGHVAVGDLNDDSFDDLVVSDSGSNTLTVLIATGYSTFAPPVNYVTQGNPTSAAIGDIDRDGRPDLFSADSGVNAVSRLTNGGGHFGFVTTPLEPPNLDRAVPTAILRISAHHRGRVSDAPLSLTSLHLGFSDADGTTLTTVQVNAILADIELRADSNGNGVYEPAADVTLGSQSSLSLDSDGRQEFALPQTPAVLVPGGGTKNYFVVVTTHPDANLQTPNSLRITHVTSASSRAVDPATDLPLALEFTPDVTTPAVIAVPVKVSAFELE